MRTVTQGAGFLSLFRHRSGIAKRFVGRGLRYAFELSVRFGMRRTSGVILCLLSRPLSKKGAKFKLLCLSKPIFNDDVMAIFERSKRLEIIFFPRLQLSSIIKKYINYYEELTDASYHVLTKDRQELDKIRQFLSVMFPLLKKLLRFDAVFAGNFVYVTQQEFFRVAREHDVPVIVLYKEGMIPRDRYQEVKETLYQTKVFLADKILFYNDMIKETLIAANMPGLTREKTTVVGIPRMDNYLDESAREGNKNKLVLFAFEPGVKANYMLNKHKQHEAFYRRVKFFHEWFIQFCIVHDQFKLTIKTKRDPKAVEYIERLVSNYVSFSRCKNISVTSAQDPRDLILNADAVAGYVSTTLLEALVAGKPILCPYFGDIIIGKSFDYFKGYEDLVNYINNYADLEAFLMNGFGRKSPSPDRLRQFLEPMIYKLDGKASERAETEIVNMIMECRRLARGIQDRR